MTESRAEPGHPPALPHTWRPRRARVVGLLMAAIVLGGGIAFAVTLPSSDAAPYGTADRVGIVTVSVIIAGGLLVLVRPRLEADDDGLVVTNFLRTRRVSWPEVVGLDMAPTESWIAFDLSDGTALPVVAVQTADGARFRRTVDELRALLDERALPPR
jgi:hypothetical protein